MALRYFYEQVPELHVIAAGSLLDFSLFEIPFPVGRVQFLEMFPLNFAEFLLAIGRDEAVKIIMSEPQSVSPPIHKLILSELKIYCFIGGMPESVKAYELKLKDNLYKLWNRMASGSYYPPSVLEVEIPKKDGRIRKLGIPTVGDRIAQMVVRDALEPQVEPAFHRNSYGYRPGRSAHDAIEKARQYCWKSVYCKDSNRKAEFKYTEFTFLGYTFRARPARSPKGRRFKSFSPAVSEEALKKMISEIKGLRIHRRVDMSIEEIAKMLNPKLKGWIYYYGKFRRISLKHFLHRLNVRLLKWIRNKYKALRYRIRAAKLWLKNVYKINPDLFAHWRFGVRP